MTVTLDDIATAAKRLNGTAVYTPLLEAPLLNQRLGYRLLVKSESLQVTGSFKFRGAYNRISQLTPQELAQGVIAYSTGNHAQAVAAAARSRKATAVIVVPKDAPAIKQTNTRAWGAELVFYDRTTEDRESIALDLAGKHGAVIVPPFDDPYVIAGQGTIGLEMVAQARNLGTELDAIVIPAGGGGLTAGIAVAVRALSPDTRIVMVEPKGYDDTLRSFAAGRRVANEVGPGRSAPFCDALTARSPGELTFAINSRLVTSVLALPDEQTTLGMYTAFMDFKLVLEPSGAIALAAAITDSLHDVLDPGGKTIGVVCSGGNVDPEVYCAALQTAAAKGVTATTP